jgi:hypothetical protein
MDFISGVIFIGITLVLTVQFFLGIAVWLELQPQQKKRPVRHGALSSRNWRYNNVRLAEV